MRTYWISSPHPILGLSTKIKWVWFGFRAQALPEFGRSATYSTIFLLCTLIGQMRQERDIEDQQTGVMHVPLGPLKKTAQNIRVSLFSLHPPLAPSCFFAFGFSCLHFFLLLLVLLVWPCALQDIKGNRM